jgi:hypothetical protein
MELEHGTRQEHLETWQRAKARGVDSAWTGDARRNPYLRESLTFGEEEHIIKHLEIKTYWDQQHSDFVWEWGENDPEEMLINEGYKKASKGAQA